MAITAADVKKLRDQTGAGMMDAKKALTEADGDFVKAAELLRITGAAKLAKRSDRDASNGIVAAAGSALIQLGAETDFVAKNDEFVSLAEQIVIAVDKAGADSVSSAQIITLASGETVAEAVSTIAAKIGEKIELVAVARFDGTTHSYLHQRSKDLRRQVLGALVKVRVGRAVETCHGDELDLLADLGRDRRDGLGHGLAGGERDDLSGGDRVGPGLVDSDDDLLGERDELVVLGDEVGLGAELDERRAGGRHDAVGSITVGTLGQLRGTGDPEQLGGLDEVAIGLSECLLSVHHPGPGLVPELLHIGSSDCHVRCTSLCWSGW